MFKETMRHVLIIVCWLEIIEFIPDTEMRTNIALHKTTKQSSTLAGLNSYWGPHKANNGDRKQTIDGKHQCTHTENDRTDWWAVDLGQEYHSLRISIYNRLDSCCSDRLSDYFIYVYRPDVTTWGNFDSRDGVLCYYHNGTSPGILNIACNRRVAGRFVQIYKPYKYRDGQNALTLCEVEMYSDVTLPVNRKGLFCKENKKRPMLFLNIQLLCTVATKCAFKCSALCLTTDACLGYAITVNGICSLVRASETVATTVQKMNYFERC